jgi:hypothetical protein
VFKLLTKLTHSCLQVLFKVLVQLLAVRSNIKDKSWYLKQHILHS